MKEGFKEQDFYDVIDLKVFEWGDNEKMKTYIRPETLFGNKFEGYLQSAKDHTVVISNDVQEITEDTELSDEEWLELMRNANDEI